MIPYEILKILEKQHYSIIGEHSAVQICRWTKKSNPMFVELKGFMSVGFARQRLGYDKMPRHKDVLDFAKKLATATGLKILDEYYYSRAFVLGREKSLLKIKF